MADKPLARGGFIHERDAELLLIGGPDGPPEYVIPLSSSKSISWRRPDVDPLRWEGDDS